ncbi:MAG: hypothetical protein A3B96_01210 [Candidatus Spechtbacteria bacterium RIFCSPHIGHO2_02_FULL_43_15b]|uniref:Formyl transferase N-terminal domain-containing protein n=1 Tax=Candidatus Spechtbacteria bacterium RIFCSPHIGHO2_01_FULL_43_30 TaxID=1802158 RepID=A0A1G2H4C4_9BACT|nr:MAG: hypothetical protein A2827_03610 [Candidatus Spechtbacteria bacterium RIFCSPHIGHO2_01_FULL_43_30]OGZ59031.1 MAG: hypothetical protein A3B96_01210 [Candidatus Spechtbacteria bacterium RIFCSPHIGHO2_02_FULL_43_15b]
MNVLFLGNKNSEHSVDLYNYFRDEEGRVLFIDRKVVSEDLEEFKPDIIVSYNYRFIIRPAVFNYPKYGAVNLHISYLPWNKGADPNFWSFIDKTAKGVTIHCIDKGLDTGDIIVQKEVEFSENDTLKTSYEKLHAEIKNLFKQEWKNIRIGKYSRRRQNADEGSYHKSADKEPLLHLLSNGWDTKVSVLADYLEKER